jgi:hypothetical protein
VPKDRVSDAAGYIKRAFNPPEGSPQDGDKAKAATLTWLEAHPEVGGLDNLLSLGGFRGPVALHDASKTEMRQFQRALLLVERTLGGKTDAQVRLIKARFVSTTGKKAEEEARQVRSEIRTVYGRWRDGRIRETGPKIIGEPILAPSFAWAKSNDRVNMRPAFLRASQLLTHAWTGVSRVGNDANEKKRLETWFGTYEAGRYGKVKETLHAVHNVICATRVTVYYRGAGTPTDATRDDSPDYIAAEADEPFGPSDDYGWVYPDARRPGEYHVFLGKAFFEDASRHGRNSLSGVLIHEMTHLVKNTEDHVYEPGPCKALAKQPGGPPKAVENADSYEFYCESYQSTVTSKFG